MYRRDGSRRLVLDLFEKGEADRIPIHVESDSKTEEFLYGDVVGVGAKYHEWRRFYIEGGPFRRKTGESLRNWVDRITLEAYDWPDVDLVVSRALESFEHVAGKYAFKRFILFKVLGPTETAESFFAPGVPEELMLKDQILHRYGFAVFLKFKPREALKIYDKIAAYILEIVKAGSEVDYVDAVRIADDIAGYSGPLYPPLLLDRYLYWHKLYSDAVEKKGKYPVLHCDGDLTRKKLLLHLSRIYKGFHPLDLHPKSTVNAARKWVERILEARKMVGEGIIFFTGIPIDLLFNNQLSVRDFLEVPLTLLRKHTSRNLVLATTHSPYPGRSYSEPQVKLKLMHLLKSLS
ncbi:MAG: hypothetical protein DRJ47_01110 [Thermoprotei archaeon]|nr:MAG: hypothetical protein DRJ47_01110 [Thermoprotei archaeon]